MNANCCYQNSSRTACTCMRRVSFIKSKRTLLPICLLVRRYLLDSERMYVSCVFCQAKSGSVVRLLAQAAPFWLNLNGTQSAYLMSVLGVISLVLFFTRTFKLKSILNFKIRCPGFDPSWKIWEISSVTKNILINFLIFKIRHKLQKNKVTFWNGLFVQGIFLSAVLFRKNKSGALQKRTFLTLFIPFETIWYDYSKSMK